MKTLWSRVSSWLGKPSDPAEKGAGGLIGAKLTDVQTTHDFFTFFNFAPTGEEKLPGAMQLISFKPTGEAFRKLVTLGVTTYGQGVITRLQLTVARSFIDDPRQCIYAADLVKSFLLAAAATTNGDAVSALASEISARSMARSTMPMITAQPLPQAPEIPSAAFMAYAGREQSRMLLYGSGKRQVQLQNGTRDEGALLDLIVSPAA